MRDSRPMVDTNILVYAHNQDSPYFAQTKALLTDLINEGGFSVSNLILFEFFSVITNGRKVEAPLHSETALYVITDMIESQNIAILQADVATGRCCVYRVNSICLSVLRPRVILWKQLGKGIRRLTRWLLHFSRQ